MSKTDQQLEKLTQAIERLVAVPPIPAIPAIAPILPIPAIPPIVATDDHDTLVALVVSVANLDKKIDDKFLEIKSDIKAINDGTTNQIADHEKRLRESEKTIVQVKTYGTALIFLSGIITTLVIKFIGV